MKKKRVLKYLHLIGEGIGEDFARALRIVEKGISTIDFDVEVVNQFRDVIPSGEQGPLSKATIELFKKYAISMKGPTRTQEGTGPQSANVALRSALKLFANIRPITYFEGVQTPVKNPQDLNVVIFRENTEDVYMGIEAEPGSQQATDLIEFISNNWQKKLPEHFKTDLVGAGIKFISLETTKKIIGSAMEYALAHNRKKVCIVHKGNIMKYTEGSFKQWCLDYIRDTYGHCVYFKGEESRFSEEQRESLIYVDTIIADDAFQQILRNPKRFDVIVTMNLNGDYLSDAAAAQVGGVPTAAGANVGDTHAMFEAIGGTADDIAGKNTANPTAFLLAFAMMLDHADCGTEANAIRDAIAGLYKEGIGTGDMKFATTLSTTDFAEQVRDRVAKILVEQAEAVVV
jgi:isocitrate dehydrogenase